MKTILFGNGLNYLSENYISWEDLLDKIKGDNLFENGKLPNTMIYERSIVGNPISFDTLTKKEEAVKNEIATMLTKFPSNAHYKKLFEINAENYLTTNYDYASLEHFKKLEEYKIVNKSTEGIYSIRRHKDIQKKEKKTATLWHVHGEIDTPPSIMLGLDHYCGSVAKIDSYVKGRYEYQSDNKTIKIKSITEKLKNNSYDNVSWIELFFKTDVHIIGLGLDYSEIDLWWVLNKRARFMLEYKVSQLIKNKIYFYNIIKKGSKKNTEQEELLKALNIVVKNVSFENNDYGGAYNEVFNKIKRTK